MSQARDDPLRTIASLGLQWPAVRRYGGTAIRPAVLVTVGLVVAALLPISVVANGPALCPFKLMTGLPCPGCGMTRSVVTLLHGDLGASLFYHPLGVVVVALAVAVALVDGWCWWRRSAPARSSPVWLLDRIMLSPAPWVAIGGLTVVWFVRLPLYVAGIWVF